MEVQLVCLVWNKLLQHKHGTLTMVLCMKPILGLQIGIVHDDSCRWQLTNLNPKPLTLNPKLAADSNYPIVSGIHLPTTAMRQSHRTSLPVGVDMSVNPKPEIQHPPQGSTSSTWEGQGDLGWFIGAYLDFNLLFKFRWPCNQ